MSLAHNANREMRTGYQRTPRKTPLEKTSRMHGSFAAGERRGEAAGKLEEKTRHAHRKPSKRLKQNYSAIHHVKIKCCTCKKLKLNHSILLVSPEKNVFMILIMSVMTLGFTKSRNFFLMGDFVRGRC